MHSFANRCRQVIAHLTVRACIQFVLACLLRSQLQVQNSRSRWPNRIRRARQSPRKNRCVGRPNPPPPPCARTLLHHSPNRSRTSRLLTSCLSPRPSPTPLHGQQRPSWIPPFHPPGRKICRAVVSIHPSPKLPRTSRLLWQRGPHHQQLSDRSFHPEPSPVRKS